MTEIAVKACYFPPYLFGSYCAPETTGDLDKTKGKWVIVEKDLNIRTGLWYVLFLIRQVPRRCQGTSISTTDEHAGLTYRLYRTCESHQSRPLTM